MKLHNSMLAAGLVAAGLCSSPAFAQLKIGFMAELSGPQGARPTELATRLRISKQALNYLLGELERLDYLERRPDPHDLRSKRVALTRRGTSAIRVIREAVGEVENAWAQQLGPKRFSQLRGLLLELNQPT